LLVWWGFFLEIQVSEKPVAGLIQSGFCKSLFKEGMEANCLTRVGLEEWIRKEIKLVEGLGTAGERRGPRTLVMVR
jgi:hypothetical protein